MPRKGSMMRLTKAQTREAEALADAHTSASINPLFQDATGARLDVLAWAHYLIKEREKRAEGGSTPGYTGRNYRA